MPNDRATIKIPIAADVETRTLDVPHLGISLRILLSAASAHHRPGLAREWALRYKGAKIGTIRLKDFSNDPP